MTTLTESTHAGEFLVSESDDGTLSREVVTIIAGSGVIPAGLVLGKITKDGTASSAAFAGNTGNGAMGAITVSAGAIPGDYKLVITEPATNAGNFTIEDPSGKFIGQGDVAAAFSAGGLAFTLADGSTDFAAGDGFTITVAAGSGKYKPYDDDNTDGSEVADAIAYASVDATSADQKVTVIARLAEVKLSAIQWAATNDATDKANGLIDLAAKNIIAR